MAELHVRPKRPSYWWLWLLIILIVLGGAYYYYKNYYSKTQVTESRVKKTDTTITVTQKKPEPDTAWDHIDFNSPKAKDSNVTDKDITVSGTDSYTIYTIQENTLFADKEATLRTTAEPKLKQIAASIKSRYQGIPLLGIYNEADSTKSSPQDRQMCDMRSAAIRDWLVRNAGANTEKVTLISAGIKTNKANGALREREISIVARPAVASNIQ